MTWATSVYRPGQDQFGGSLTDVGGYAGVTRITALTWWDNEANGNRYLHAGLAHNPANTSTTANIYGLRAQLDFEIETMLEKLVLPEMRELIASNDQETLRETLDRSLTEHASHAAVGNGARPPHFL